MKNIILLSCFIIFSNELIAQINSYYIPTGGSTYATSSGIPDWYANLEKYWFYRYRLVEDFTYVGPKIGETMIAYRRTKGDDYDASRNNTLDFADDQTNDLGTYIGVLSTEYKQLKDNGLSTSRTLWELQYAQNAFDRLRKHGTEYYSDMQTTYDYSLPIEAALITGDITNGFFVRDDVPFWDFILPGYALNQKHIAHFNRPALIDAGGVGMKSVIACVGGAFNGSWHGTDPFGHTIMPTSIGLPNCESQDQLNQLYIGEQQAIKYLDPSDAVAGPLRIRAENALYHSMKYLEHHEGSPFLFYSIPKPTDPCCECAKDDCSRSGFFYPSALPAMYGLHGFMPSSSSWYSETNTLQSETNNVLSYFAYAAWMQESILCCNYASQNIVYTDGYTCFGPELAFFSPLFPTWVNYLIWRGSSTATKRNNSWYAVKRHAGQFSLNAPHTPLIFQLNFGDRSWSENGTIETELTNAPKCGTWCYENSNPVWTLAGHEDYMNDYGHSFTDWNWSGNSWVSDAGHRQGHYCHSVIGTECYEHSADQGSDCDLNGLDYMWLFNLYSLERGGAGHSYLGGIMNSYYCENFNVNYPSAGIGSYTNQLKLNFLEYVSLVDIINGTSSPAGWLDISLHKQ